MLLIVNRNDASMFFLKVFGSWQMVFKAMISNTAACAREKSESLNWSGEECEASLIVLWNVLLYRRTVRRSLGIWAGLFAEAAVTMKFRGIFNAVRYVRNLRMNR